MSNIHNDEQKEDEEFVEDLETSQEGLEKIKRLQQKLKTCQKERQEYLDGWQRTKADYVNVKREQELEGIKKTEEITANIISKIFPLFESLDRAVQEFTNTKEVKKGIERIKMQYESLLDEFEVEPISEIKVPFDPHIHESVGIKSIKKKEEDHLVVEVIEKGYKIGMRTIRPAKVRVAIYK